MVSLVEVREAVAGFSSFAAPGPDGYQASLYKIFWDLVGNQVWDFVRKAIRDGLFEWVVAKKLICLIPKVEIPKEINQFGPISLCNVLYKNPY